MKVDNGTINFAVYEGPNEYLGMAEVTMPELSMTSEDITGAGIAGTFQGPYQGHFDPFSVTLNFRSTTPEAATLFEPKAHQLELRAAQQKWNAIAGKNEVDQLKYVLIVTPLKYSLGKLAPAKPNDASGEYSCSYYAEYVNGKKIIEIDIFNFKCMINGTDYLKDVRAALGK